MILCPFCHFQNEDGALFCEQCKSDLSGVPETPAANPVPTAPLTPEPVVAQPVEAVPMSVEPVAVPLVEPEPLPAEPLPAELYPLTAEPEPVMEAMPLEAMPVEAVPVEAEPLSPAAGMIDTQAPPQVAEPVVPPAPPPPPKKVEPPPPPKVEAPPPPPPKVETPLPPPQVEALPSEAVLPTGAEPRLLVLRGQRRNVEYPIYEGLNFIGRADEKPVDIDLEDQEPPDRIWCSRQHALVSLEEGKLVLEDLNSANGTYLNRNRVYPGQKQPLKVNDIIQIGNVQLKVIV